MARCALGPLARCRAVGVGVMNEDRWFLFVRCWCGFLAEFPFGQFDHVHDDEELGRGLDALCQQWADDNPDAIEAFVRERLSREMKRRRPSLSRKTASRRGHQGPTSGTSKRVTPEEAAKQVPSADEVRANSDLLLEAAGWRARSRRPRIYLEEATAGDDFDPRFHPMQFIVEVESQETAGVLLDTLRERMRKGIRSEVGIRGLVRPRLGIVAAATLSKDKLVAASLQIQALLDPASSPRTDRENLYHELLDQAEQARAVLQPLSTSPKTPNCGGLTQRQHSILKRLADSHPERISQPQLEASEGMSTTSIGNDLRALRRWSKPGPLILPGNDKGQGISEHGISFLRNNPGM